MFLLISNYASEILIISLIFPFILFVIIPFIEWLDDKE